MQLKRKLPWILTGKALIATGSMAMVALALVTYTATLTINFNPFFIQGTSTMTWSATTSTGTRYFQDGAGSGSTNPNGTVVPTTLSPSTNYAFVTQNSGAGYVKIAMGTAANPGDFLSFKIFVLTYNGTTTKWVNATLYTASTGTAVLTGGMDGTSLASAAYLHVNAAQGNPPTFYMIQVNYVLQGTPVDTTSTTVVFDFTPSLN